MKKVLSVVFCVSMLLTLPGCGWLKSWFAGGCGSCSATHTHSHDHGQAGIKKLSAVQLKMRMESEKDLKVINVLSAESYQDCSIVGSTNIPLAELEEKTATWDKATKIVVYCASYTCSASKKAYETLVGKGFTNVLAYEGGSKEWKQKGFLTEGPCAADYLK